MKLRLLPFMCQFILLNIRAYLENRQPVPPPETTDDYMTSIRIAFADQCLIGWDRYLRGFIASSWKDVDDKWCQNNGRPQRNILHSLVYASVQYSHSVWQDRCIRVHEPDHRSVHHRYLTQQAQSLYDQGRDRLLLIHRSNRSLFPEAPAFDRYSFPDIQCWIQAASLVLNQLPDS